MTTPAITKTAAFENYPDNKLTRGRYEGTSLATGASLSKDVEVQATDWLVVQGNLVGTANGDLSVTVTPYEEDNRTLTAFTLNPIESGGPTNQGGAVRFYGKYDVVGLDRVQISWKNNNAATKVLTRASWEIESF